MAIIFYIFTTLLALGIMAFAAYLAYKRGFFKSLVKCGIAFLSLLLSIIITKLISHVTKDAFAGLADLVVSNIGSEGTLAELIESSDTFEILFAALPAAIIAPFIFVIVFFVLKLILDLVFHIVEKNILKGKINTEFKYSKGVSCVFGCIIAFLCIFSALVPINGFVTVFANVYDVVSTLDEENGSPLFDGVVDGLNKNPVKTVTYAMGGRAVFNTLTSIEIDGETYSIGREITGLSAIASRTVSLYKTDVESWGEEQARMLREIPEALSGAKLVKTIISDVASIASSSWINNEDFGGIKLPSNVYTNPIVNDMLAVFADSSGDTIGKDLETVCETLAVLCDNGAFHLFFSSSGSEPYEVLEVIGKENFVKDIFLIFDDNERFKPLVGKFTEFGLENMARSLSVPTNEELQQKIYKELASKLEGAYALEKEEGRKAAERGAVSVFDKYQILLSENTAKCVASSLYEGLFQSEKVDDEKVASYFEGLYAVSEYPDISAEQFIEKYSEKNGSEAASSLFGADKAAQSAAFNNRVELIKKVKADEKSLEILLSLAPSCDIISKDTTIESIQSESLEGVSREEIEELGVALGHSARELSKVAGDISKFDKNASGVEIIKKLNIEALGGAFEEIGDNKYIGDTSIGILDAFLKNKVGFTMNIRDILNNSDDPNAENSTISSLLVGFYDTVLLIDNLNNAEKTHDDKIPAVDEFMKNLDPAKAKSLSKAMNPQTIENFGVPEGKAEAASDMLAVMLEELGDTEKNSESEAEAVKYLFDISMTSKSSENTVFGEGGKIEDVDNFVKTVKGSTVAANTLKASTTNDKGESVKDPLGIAEKLTNEDEKTLLDAIDAASKEAGTTESEKETLRNLADMFGVEWAA